MEVAQGRHPFFSLGGKGLAIQPDRAHFWRLILRIFAPMPGRICAIFLLLGANGAWAQAGSCITSGLLRVDAASTREGAGGTFNYLAQISNVTNRPVTFRITFRMTSAQVNPQILGRSFTLPRNGSGLFLVASGTRISTAQRIGGGLLLNC